MTTVSVVIPTFNRCELTLRALSSVYEQTHLAAEIIVVDDGSTDATVAAISAQFPDVIVISQVNRGVSAARNLGIKTASGEWVAFLDSDDCWHTSKLARQLQLAGNYPEIRIIHCDEHWLRNGKTLNQKTYHRKSGGDIFAPSLQRCLISPSAALIKRDLLLEIGLFDESLPACEDYDLWLRICATQRVGFVPEVLLTKHGGHADQLSKSIWGLDRFRIRSLSKLLVSGKLNAEQTQLANSVLQKKTRIFAQGAKKRGRLSEAREFTKLAAQIDGLCA